MKEGSWRRWRSELAVEAVDRDECGVPVTRGETRDKRVVLLVEDKGYSMEASINTMNLN